MAGRPSGTAARHTPPTLSLLAMQGTVGNQATAAALTSGTVRVAQRQPLASPATTDPLTKILPGGLGLIAAIGRSATLLEIFGNDLDAFAAEVAADPAATKFTRETGIFGLVALAETRGPTGFDIPRAREALTQDEKRKPDDRRYTYERFGLRDLTQPSTYWFESKRPEKADESTIEGAIAAKHQLFVDPAILTLSPPPATKGQPATGLQTVHVRMAYPGSERRDGRPSKQMERARGLVLKAIANVMKSLAEVPDVFGTKAEMQQQRLHDLQVRARLKEATRGFTAERPLNVFITSDWDMKLSEMAGRLALTTQPAWISVADLDDPAKLQAAVRVPFLALFGGFTMAGERAPLTPEQLKEAALHELLHVLLIRQGIHAEAVWQRIGPGVVDGPPVPRNRAEELVHLFLYAQEEVWVYQNVAEMYSGFIGNLQPYTDFVDMIDIFLSERRTQVIEKRTDIPVSERVGLGKKKSAVDWSITFKVPKLVRVSAADITRLNDLISHYPGR